MTDYRDVYETEDLPEAEQDFEEDTKDCVEKLNINIPVAFNRFKGKEITPKENAIKSKIISNGNPFERANRILSELSVLSKEVETNYENSNAKDEPVTKDQLMMLIEGLSVQVKELDLKKHFGDESNFEIKDPKKIIYKKLTKHIDELEFELPKDSVDSSKHSYVLTSNVDVNEHLNQMKMANIHKRLDILEKVLGDDSVKLSSVSNECPNKGLVEVVDRLTAKTSLLNNQQLNAVESRLTGVANKLQTLTTVASNATSLDQESQLKIAELYELVKKYDHVMDTVPSIVDQCVSMQDFHIKSVKLGQCINNLDVKQQEMCFKQQTDQMILKNIQDTMPENFATMEKNMQIIYDKLKTLG